MPEVRLSKILISTWVKMDTRSVTKIRLSFKVVIHVKTSKSFAYKIEIRVLASTMERINIGRTLSFQSFFFE